MKETMLAFDAIHVESDALPAIADVAFVIRKPTTVIAAKFESEAVSSFPSRRVNNLGIHVGNRKRGVGGDIVWGRKGSYACGSDETVRSLVDM